VASTRVESARVRPGDAGHALFGVLLGLLRGARELGNAPGAVVAAEAGDAVDAHH
jgi:hypothetical protein